MLEKQTTENQLKKELGFFSAIMLVIGMVIGSGIFMKPGKVIAAAGDSTQALIAWGLGGLITLAAGLTIAELGAQIPKTGGLYTYLREVYGKVIGYLFGWMQTIVYGPATIAALGLYFSSLCIPFLDLPEFYKTPLTAAVLIFLTAMNALGSKYGGAIQTAATIGKLVPIVLIALCGILTGTGNVLAMPSGLSSASGMGTAVLATLWAYDGWIGVTYVAGEMKNPARELPKAIFLGLGIVIAAYLFVNLALLKLFSAADIVAFGTKAAGQAAIVLFGNYGGLLINLGILVSVFGALNGYIMTNARVPFAMAQQNQLPGASVLKKVHPKWGSPVNAGCFQLIMAVGFVMAGDPDRLTDLAMFAIWLFYILAFLAVIILRCRKGSSHLTYRVPLYPIVPLIAILGSIYIVGSTLVSSTTDCLYSIGVTCLGIPVYFWLKRRDNA
ncbi:MAG: amino acid permease [Sporomusaceae bacterium]|nr:amino acid permease [Sporomusaceae bacterium]